LETIEVAEETVCAVGDAAEDNPAWDWGEEDEGYEPYSDPEDFIFVKGFYGAGFELGEGVDDGLFGGATGCIASEVGYSLGVTENGY
jgi:hypothetical protein